MWCTYRFGVVSIANRHILAEQTAERILLLMQRASHNEKGWVIPEPDVRLLWRVLNAEAKLQHWC